MAEKKGKTQTHIFVFIYVEMVHSSNHAGVIYNISALVFPYMYILYILLQHYLFNIVFNHDKKLCGNVILQIVVNFILILLAQII